MKHRLPVLINTVAVLDFLKGPRAFQYYAVRGKYDDNQQTQILNSSRNYLTRVDIESSPLRRLVFLLSGIVCQSRSLVTVFIPCAQAGVRPAIHMKTCLRIVSDTSIVASSDYTST